MFRKKLFLNLPSKFNSNLSTFIQIKETSSQLKKLEDYGYNLYEAEDIGYKYLKFFIKPWFIYLQILIQDLLKLSVFNKNRDLVFSLALQSFNLPLSEKQKQLIQNSSPVLENEVIGIELEKVYAFYSSDTGVGKTLISEEFSQTFSSSKIFSYSFCIKTLLANIANSLGYDYSRFFENYDKKDLKTSFGNEPKQFVTRDVLCDFGYLLKKYYSENIISDYLINDIKFSQNISVAIIDDLRTVNELEQLKKEFGSKLVTVKLNKESTTKKQTSEVASTLQNQLDNYTFDIDFTFNEDWSNKTELYSLLNKNKV